MLKKACLTLLLASVLTHFGQAQIQRETLITDTFVFNNVFDVMKKFEQKYELVFDYPDELFTRKVLPTMEFDKTLVDDALAQLFGNFEVEWLLSDDRHTVYIRPAGTEIIDPHFINPNPDPTRFKFSFQGKISDEFSGETLPSATILIKSTLGGAATNVDGYFTLLNVPSDTSTVILRYLGYFTKEVKLRPEMIKEKGFTEFVMEPMTNVIDEIVIVEQKEHMMKASEGISTVSVSPQQLAAMPSLGEKDVFRSLQYLPGISATNETSSGLYVRGGTPDQNLVLFDGFTVYHVDHFYGFFSAFNANSIKDIQLYKGGFEAKYGGRISSVVEMTGKNGNTNDLSGNLGLSALSVNGAVETPFADSKGSLFLSFRRSYTDLVKSGMYSNINNLFSGTGTQAGMMGGGPPGGPGGGFGGRGFGQNESEPTFHFYDLNAKLSYRPSTSDIFSFSFYNGKDMLDASDEFDSGMFGGFVRSDSDFENESVDLSDWGNFGTSFKWGRQWNPKTYTNTTVSYSNYFANRDKYSTTEITRNDSTFETYSGTFEDNNVHDFTFKSDTEYLLNKQHLMSFGGQLTVNSVNYTNIANDTLTVLDRQDDGYTASFYGQDSWKPMEKLNIIPGIRATYYNGTEKLYVEPRVGMSYSLTDRLKAKAAWGLYHQFVTRVTREDLSQGSRDFWLLANEELNPVSSAYHYILGVQYETDNFLFDVEAYYKDMSGLSEYTLRFSNDFRTRTVEMDELFYNGTGIAKGIEFLAQKKYGKYTGWASYTLSQVMHDFPELSNNPFPALHDQTHEFKSVNSLRLGRWTMSGTWVFASGKPYTTPVGWYEVELLDGTTKSFLSVGEKNAYRLPNYHRLDLSVIYNIKVDKYRDTEVGLSIFNVYNHSNVWYKTFEIVDDQVVTTNVNTIGITPNLFINFKF